MSRNDPIGDSAKISFAQHFANRFVVARGNRELAFIKFQRPRDNFGPDLATPVLQRAALTVDVAKQEMTV